MTTSEAYALEEMSWPEVKAALETVKLAIIPVGSTEQHGPNIGESADIARARAGALALANRLHPRAIVAPAFPFGISSHHMRFPGTITIRVETFVAVLRDVVGSLKEHGIEKFFIINGHGGNIPALGVATWQIRDEMGVKIAHALHWPSPQAIEQFQRSPRVGHACEIETSLAMYLTPNIAKVGALATGEVKDPSYTSAMTAGPSSVVEPRYFDEITANGALGDATQASEEAGEVLARDVEDRLTEFLERFLAE